MSHRILIVDDEEMIRMSLSGLLQDHGYEVVTAKNGLECIQLMSNQDFDLVMMDIVMPGINGIETLKTIKERHKTDVIMISAYADKEKAIASLRLNAYDFVEKPFESKGILNIIAHCLDRLELRKDLERKTVELATAEEKYRDLYENAPDIYHSLDKNGCIIEINQTGLNSLGYIKSELIGRHFTGLLTDNSKKEFEKYFPVLFEKGRLAERERQIIRKDGSIIDVSINTSVMYDEKGKPSVTRAIMRDITEKKKLENTLKETRDYLENLLNFASAPIIVWDPSCRITRFNHAFENLTGYTEDEVIGQELHLLFPKAGRKESRDKIAETLSGEYWESVEIPILRKDGGIRTALWNSANIYTTDGATLIATIAQGQDITERKQQTTELIRSNREKALLLKEIHHRVKNNLQIIASLLRLNTKYSGDERVEEIFRESQDRIRAMAAVHSMLYKSESFSEINFGEYIRETARQLFRSYNTNPEAISLLINADDVMIPIDTAIPCGLIINELVSNALKHAFPAGRRGEIRIEMKKDENGVRIIFEDNGVDFPEGMDFRNTETLGLQLVNMLVAQLDGAIEMVGNGGTRYVITLKTGKEI